MKLDVYEPVGDEETSSRAAVVLVFGGAFHRGSKEGDSFSQGASHNSSVTHYAERWAELGFVTFCIDYRLIPEDPDPGPTIVLTHQGNVGAQRMNAARISMGLDPATPEMLANGVEAGADDTHAAATFVRDHAAQWRVDPRRIALWGWSAGARNVLNAVFAEGFDAAAVIALSPYVHTLDLMHHIPSFRDAGPLFLASAERDLPHISEQMPVLVSHFAQRLPKVIHLKILENDHFYPAQSTVVGHQTELLTLEDAMTEFLLLNV
ncbi:MULTISPECIES: alpha/beta hydrolase [unclassified Acidovorax]|uniref:alpha/beta hydrolase n=1 Tax=unclassified Acidovorax TaxID=2684926 RepID=UPI00234A6F87|nr:MULTISPECIES: alpha/beta hydrolase [unclassified Acidovorax]